MRELSFFTSLRLPFEYINVYVAYIIYTILCLVLSSFHSALYPRPCPSRFAVSRLGLRRTHFCFATAPGQVLPERWRWERARLEGEKEHIPSSVLPVLLPCCFPPCASLPHPAPLLPLAVAAFCSSNSWPRVAVFPGHRDTLVTPPQGHSAAGPRGSGVKSGLGFAGPWGPLPPVREQREPDWASPSEWAFQLLGDPPRFYSRLSALTMSPLLFAPMGTYCFLTCYLCEPSVSPFFLPLVCPFQFVHTWRC